MTTETARKMCFTKRRFPSMIKAFCFIGKQRAYYPEHDELRAYECPVCRGWHTTTKKANSEPQQFNSDRLFVSA